MHIGPISYTINVSVQLSLLIVPIVTFKQYYNNLYANIHKNNYEWQQYYSIVNLVANDITVKIVNSKLRFQYLKHTRGLISRSRLGTIIEKEAVRQDKRRGTMRMII